MQRPECQYLVAWGHRQLDTAARWYSDHKIFTTAQLMPNDFVIPLVEKKQIFYKIAIIEQAALTEVPQAAESRQTAT